MADSDDSFLDPHPPQVTPPPVEENHHADPDVMYAATDAFPKLPVEENHHADPDVIYDAMDAFLKRTAHLHPQTGGELEPAPDVEDVENEKVEDGDEDEDE